jgi:hypothetical protein
MEGTLTVKLCPNTASQRKLAQATTFPTYRPIREVPGSNLSEDIDMPDLECSQFSSVTQQNAGGSTLNRPQSFASSSAFVNHPTI